jgi:hypothetical protein
MNLARLVAPPEVPMTQDRSTPQTGTAPTDGKAAEPFTIPEEVLDAWRWIAEERQKGTFDDYRGQHIAVLDRQLLGAGRDPDLLRELLALKNKIDPERLVIAYIDQW